MIGYSDASLLLHALYKKSGVRGIMGPMILPQFAEYPEMQKFSLNSFFEVVKNLGKNKVYELPKAEEYTEEMLLWDQEDIKSREMKKNSGWEIIFSGKASGRLVPTNLNTLCKLIGTPYMPDLEGAILFLEDDGDESAATIQRMLQHLKQAGQLDWIKGIVFGRFQEKSEITNDDIKFLLGNVFNEVSFPVISNVDFGHTDPMITLPIGNSVSISTQLSQIKITL
ncbi:MAG: Microcin C7 self-immunity protein MccF [Parcubacteria group bacterium ADurb.Bin326]|nr:MAG: Microcin C7 self-immunity protein MccF [Parcubacteria group bacterium ADurb.Bin326]